VKRNIRVQSLNFMPEWKVISIALVVAVAVTAGMVALDARADTQGYGFGDITAYAEIYVSDGSTPQSSLDTTPVKLTGFAADGESYRATPDHTDDSITIEKAGTYLVELHVSFSGSVSATFEMHVRVNAVEKFPGIHRKMNTAGDAGSAAASGLLVLAQGDVVTIYVEADAGSKAVTIIDASMCVSRIR